ncbi:MAG TPA: alpha/beta fold hydrolase [Azospirillaceae bacterium]|nr:alpha/beta fold hydrolase [Azospirillaceae bacterium]
MTRIRKAYVDTPAGQVHYRQHGGGSGTPIVFLHQTASSGAMWEEVMRRLPQDRPLYALDTPGFGGSFDPEGFQPMEQYAAWVLAAIDGIGLKRFHICGHHTGACIGVDIAAKNPDRVASLAMIGPVPLTQEERDAFRQHYQKPMSPTADGSYLLQTWEYLRGLGAHSDLTLHHREVVDTLRAWMGRFQVYTAVWDQDFIGLMKQVRCPMHLMCAPDDVLMPFLDRARELRPDATSKVLKGANFEPDQDPEGTTAEIVAFLARAEAAVAA